MVGSDYGRADQMIYYPKEFYELKNWIWENAPELRKAVGPMSSSQFRLHMNELLGMDIQGDHQTADACKQYLDALKDRHTALPL